MKIRENIKYFELEVEHDTFWIWNGTQNRICSEFERECNYDEFEIVQNIIWFRNRTYFT